MTRRLIDYGPAAALLECADLAEVLGLLPQLRGEPKINELIPGARTVLLRLDAPWMRRNVAAWNPCQREAPKTMIQDRIRIEVDYSGRTFGRWPTVSTPAEVVELHTGQTWTVGFCGFAPASLTCKANTTGCGSPGGCAPRPRAGRCRRFGGLVVGDLSTRRPRRLATHRPTEAQLWDLNRTPPALLQPGFQVRFTATAS